MSTHPEYSDAAGSHGRTKPRPATLADGGKWYWPKGTTDGEFAARAGCSVEQAEDPEPAPPGPKHYDKLKLSRGLRAIGGKQMLKDMFKADPDMADDWADAPYIAEDDPAFGPALAAFGVASGMTTEEMATILGGCQV